MQHIQGVLINMDLSDDFDFLFSIVMPIKKAIIRLLEFRICLLMFSLHTAVLYLKRSEFRWYKHSKVRTVVSLHCLSWTYVTEHHSTFCRKNKTVHIKYTLADVTLFWPFKLGNTTLILYTDDSGFVPLFPYLLGRPRAAVVHLNLGAGSTFPVPVCTVSPGL